MAFPVSPTNGQITEINGIFYQFVAADSAWVRVPGNNLTVGNLTANNITSNGNVTASRVYTTNGLFWSGNGVAFSSGSSEGVDANIGTLFLGNVSTQANLGAFQTYANTTFTTLDANIGTLFLGNASTNANLGAFQTYANTSFTTLDANIGTLFLGNASTNANLGAYQTYANVTLNDILSNLGAFEIYANTKIGTNAGSNLVIDATTTSTNTTTGALVVKGGAGIAGNAYIGGNIVVTSNISANKFFTTEGLYWAGNGTAFSSGGGGSTPGGSDTQVQFNDGGSALGGDSTFSFNKTSKILSVQQISVTNSSGDEGGEILLAKATTNTTLSGTGVTVDVYQNKLRFFEQGGSARGYYLDISSGGGGASTNIMSGGGGGTPAGLSGDIQFNNGGAFGSTSLFYDSASGNIVLTDTTDSTSNVTGAMVIKGGLGVAGNVFANTIYTNTGIRWAGNGVAFSSGGGGGGGGLTYTSDTSSPGSPALGDQWYDTSTDILYEYIEDGTSSYWVDVQSPIFSSGITNSVVGNVSITGPTSSIGHLTVARTITASGNIITLSNISVSKSANILGNLTVGGNVAFSRDATIAANLTVTGNIASGNVTTANITATGNITTLGSISGTTLSTANITVNSNVTAGNVSTSNLTVTSNIIAANTTSDSLTVTGNISASNLTVISNVTANDLIVNGNVSLTGANVYLGNVANLSIAGGTSGQVLQTNGAGTLSWETLPATNIQEFTATASQTTFTVVGTYTVGSVLVFVNGIQMNSVDYTATSGTTVVLAEPRNVGDTVRIIGSYGAASLVSGLTLNVNNLQTFAVAMSIAMGM